MAKMTIDINYGMLAAAARIFDTLTKTSTINAALADAVERRERGELSPSPREGELSPSPREDVPAGCRPDGCRRLSGGCR
jgi:Arc/MetJ family transcription regulator